MQNLVDNAAKFMGDQKQPHDRDRHRAGAGPASACLFVRDNGIGIDPRFRERVFRLFEKLDPGSEGSGVGLALDHAASSSSTTGACGSNRRAKGKGTTVCFTLPDAAASALAATPSSSPARRLPAPGEPACDRQEKRPSAARAPAAAARAPRAGRCARTP